MLLEDLFVNHKQVEPVHFQAPDVRTELDGIYANLDRVQRFVQPHDAGFVNSGYNAESPAAASEPALTRSSDMSTWRTATAPSSEPGNPVNPGNPGTPANSKFLRSRRSTKHYAYFKQELEKFIAAHPEYAGIKNELDYLAASESAYHMGIENTQGSSALGWFQFLDGTRHTYNNQTRQQFAKDPQAQLLAAAQHYTALQRQVRSWGGNPNDFATMYGAWWLPAAAKKGIQNPGYDYKTNYGESLSGIHATARKILGQQN